MSPHSIRRLQRHQTSFACGSVYQALATTTNTHYTQTKSYKTTAGPNSFQDNRFRQREQVHYQGQFLSVVRFFFRHMAG